MTRARRLVSVIAVGVVIASAGTLAVDAHAATPAHTYYMAPGGNGNGSASSPWGTFAAAFQVVRAGDELVLRDGEYHDALAPPSSLNGTATAPIVVRADHDGQARINGDGARIPIQLNGNDWFTIQGIVAFNSSMSVIAIDGSSDTNYASHNTLQRVSAYNSAATCQSGDSPSACNAHIYEIYRADHTLVEDCVGAGRARTIADANKTDTTTFRRCWFRGDKGTNWNGTDLPGGVTIYNSTNSRLENNIFADVAPGTSYGFGQHDWNNVYGGPNSQVNVDNAYLGNIVLGPNNDPMGTSVTQCKLSRDHVYRDNVVVQTATSGSQRAISMRGGKNQLLDHMTVIGNTTASTGSAQQGFWASMSSYSDQSEDCSPHNSSGQHYGAWGFYRDPPGSAPAQRPGFDFTLTLSNTVVQGFRVGVESDTNAQATPKLTLDHDVVAGNHQNFAGNAVPSSLSSNPLTFATATYGRGAYLLGATNAPAGADGQPVGAHVLYRYVDGVLTNQPLWPWPMEDRVWNETGNTHYWESANAIYSTRFQESATWDGANGRTHGLWKSLDGVYPPPTTTTTTSTSTTTSSTSTSTTTSTTTTTVPTPPPTRFRAGDHVKVVAVANVYQWPTPSAAFLGTQKKKRKGTVLLGWTDPQTKKTWWAVDFNQGPDGWVLDNTLAPG